MIKIETKTNGFEAAGIKQMIGIFERAAQKLFPDCTLEHFYYGDHLDMADITLPHEYAHFNITANRVSLTGYTCSHENYIKFEKLTYRDECFPGKLLEIAK